MNIRIPIAVLKALVLFVFGVNSICAQAQERFLVGSIITGGSYYRYGSNPESRMNPFTVLRLDHRSYILDPRLMSYELSPRFSSGFEDFNRGQPEGTGLRFTSDIFRNAPWPVNFYYERIRRFSPTLAPGSDEIRNVHSRLGLGIRYAVPGRPLFSFRYNKFSGLSDPGNNLLRESETGRRELAFSGRHYLKGWEIYGAGGNNTYQSLIFFDDENGALDRKADRRTKHLNLRLHRDFGKETTFTFTATRDSTDTLSGSRLYAYGISQIVARLTSDIGEKFRVHLQGRYQGNLLQAPSAFSPAAFEENPLPGISRGNADRSGSTMIQYLIKPYLIISGTFQYKKMLRTFERGAFSVGSSMSGNSDISLKKGGRYWILNSQYRLNLSRIRSLDGESSQFSGHSMNSGFGVGDVSVVRATANYAWSRSQRDDGILFASKNNSQRIILDISKRAFGVLLEARGGLRKRQSDAWNRLSESVSRDFRLSMRIPRLQLTYSRQTGSGDAWQYIWLNPQISLASGVGATTEEDPVRLALPELAAAGVTLRAHGERVPESAATLYRISSEPPSGSGDLSGVVADLELLSSFRGSSLSSTAVTASLTIASNIRVNGTWQRRWQSAETGLRNRFERRDVTFEWRIRQMVIEASYFLDRYDAGSRWLRNNAIIRITRNFRIF